MQNTSTAPASSSAPSMRKAMSAAAVVMVASVFLSRVLGIVREQVLAYSIGAGPEMDAYMAAFLLPDIVNHLLAGGFMSITFIPIFHRHLVNNDEAGAWRSFSNILTIGTLVLWGFIALGLLLTPEILGLMGGGISDPRQLALTTRMTRIILPAQFFIYWGSLLMAVQYARTSFLVPALAPLLYNVGIIAGGLLLGPSLGVEGFAWGVLAGAFAGNFAVQFAGALRAGMDLRIRFDLRDPDLRTYVVLTVPLMLGVGMQFSNETLYRVFGSFLSAGSIACLGYATKVFMTLDGLFGQALGVASFPFLSKLAAEGKLVEMNRVAHRVMGRIAVLALPSSAILMVLAHPVIVVLFERGKFSSDAGRQTATLLVLYCIGAFAFAANTIVVRCFYAMQNTLIPMGVSTAVVAISIPIYWGLAAAMGAAGVALAGALSMNLMLAGQLWFWYRTVYDAAELRGLAIVGAKAFAAAAAAAAATWGVVRALAAFGVVERGGSLWGNLVIVCVAGCAGIAVAGAILATAGLLDVRAIVARVLAKMPGHRRNSTQG